MSRNDDVGTAMLVRALPVPAAALPLNESRQPGSSAQRCCLRSRFHDALAFYLHVSTAPTGRRHGIRKVVMQVFHSIGQACGGGLRAGVGGLIAALDRLTLLVGRVSESVEASLARRTPHLRSRRRPDGRQPLDLPFLHF